MSRGHSLKRQRRDEDLLEGDLKKSCIYILKEAKMEPSLPNGIRLVFLYFLARMANGRQLIPKVTRTEVRAFVRNYYSY